MLIYENPSCEDARWATEFLSVMPFDSRCMYGNGLGGASHFGYDKFNVAHRIIAISFFVEKKTVYLIWCIFSVSLIFRLHPANDADGTISFAVASRILCTFLMLSIALGVECLRRKCDLSGEWCVSF